MSVFIDKSDIELILWAVVDEFLIPRYNELGFGMGQSGRWQSSLEVEVGDNSGVIKGAHYSYWLVHGRAPASGTPQFSAEGGRPPIPVILAWVTEKFGYTGKQALNTAFAVANKIAKEGTKYYPSGTDLLEVLSSKECIEFMNKKISYIMVKKVELRLIRELKRLEK